MSKPINKKNRLKENLYGFDVERIENIINNTNLEDREKDLMRFRWLVRVENMEKDAQKSKVRHFTLKLIIIAGSAFVPVLASLNEKPDAAFTTQGFVYYATLIVSLIVSISAGVHEFFRYGDRWRHYRGTVEKLKSEGWHFIQQTGRYRKGGGHSNSYKRFAERIERMLSEERARFMAEIAQEKTGEDKPTEKVETATPPTETKS